MFVWILGLVKHSHSVFSFLTFFLFTQVQQTNELFLLPRSRFPCFLACMWDPPPLSGVRAEVWSKLYLGFTSCLKLERRRCGLQEMYCANGDHGHTHGLHGVALGHMCKKMTECAVWTEIQRQPCLTFTSLCTCLRSIFKSTEFRHASIRQKGGFRYCQALRFKHTHVLTVE